MAPTVVDRAGPADRAVASPLPSLFRGFTGGVEGHAFRRSCHGTIEDLAKLELSLGRGMLLRFYDGNADDGLGADGVVDYLEPWGWIAHIDPTSMRHVSERSD